MSIVLRTTGLSKSFKGKEVVSEVSMTIRKGEIYGFLGPNGAGKTTVMRMLTGLVAPSGGTIELFGEPVRRGEVEPLKRMGSMIEYPVFYEHLSAQQNMRLHCDYMGCYDPDAIGEALRLAGLKDTGGKPVKAFSLGMKQRLGIARAICAKPELLILDEPVNGMDPVGIRELRELFRALSKDYGITILISSHILQEIEVLADTIGIIHEGKLVEEVSMEQVRNERTACIEAVTSDARQAAFVIEEQLGIRSFKVLGNDTVRVYDPRIAPSELARALVLHGIGLTSLTRRNVSLEEQFLKWIQGGKSHGDADEARASKN
ncbi:ABC transporter ATP-binding protein [Paenibacillus arenilitoris]|uniref:ABC transporter ATP-binding protein n=1 Tax=Paenibacillus arenilitoris TaxID=2772299 RepID=A0A927H695_9BACL|nr:ABC transporter ATP-binding protein [Paenibacillus arenilitoris]MBD2869750.1 ABC transporter ATP-binding protein [Paenibacillus arenilitoris]